MPISKRFKTTYPGVYFIKGPSSGSRKQEKIYYIRYRKNGKLVEEKAGRQLQDNMTPARAAGVRSQKIEGNKLTNEEQASPTSPSSKKYISFRVLYTL